MFYSYADISSRRLRCRRAVAAENRDADEPLVSVTLLLFSIDSAMPARAAQRRARLMLAVDATDAHDSHPPSESPDPITVAHTPFSPRRER